MKTKFKLRKTISILLSLILILSSVSALSAVTAYADDDETYIYYDKEFYEEYKAVADALAEGIKNHESSIIVSEYNFPRDREKITELMYVVLYMHPEFFYFDQLGYSYDSSNMIYAFKPTYKYDKTTSDEMMAEFEDCADEYLGSVTSDMSEFEKALALHDELVLHSSYLLDTDVYDLMVKKQGRCYGYAEAYSYLLAKVGIKSEEVISDDMNHQWNKVRIDGKWYHVDVTWDDPTPNKDGQVLHTYFLLSDSAFPNSDHYNFTSSFEADTKYDSYSYHTSRAKFCKLYGNLYTINDKKLSVYDYSTDTSEKVSDLNYIWSAGGNSYWQGTFSSLESYDGYLYYNSPDTVYAYEPIGKTTEEVGTKTSGNDFYGFRIKSGKVYSARAASPNVTRELEYLADALENKKIYTSSDGTALSVDSKISRESDDTVLTNIENEFKNIELLGVQAKKSSLEATDDETQAKSVRFVAVVNNSILNDADDYGFIAIGSKSKDYTKSLISDAYLGNTADRHIFSCSGSDNNVSGDYGKYSADKKYKYVTFAINNLGDNSAAVKFFVKKGNKTYYASYTSDTGNESDYCCVSWTDLVQS